MADSLEQRGGYDTSGGAPAGSFADRDLVTFYSRLTRTIENMCGRDRLAALLAQRLTGTDDGASAEFLSCLVRAFRRMGVLTRSGRGAGLLAGEFLRSVSVAVSRPERQVALLFELFVYGDDAGGTKAVCGATPHCVGCLLSRECEQFNRPPKPEMAIVAPSTRLLEGDGRSVSDAELLSVLLMGDKGTGREEQVEALLARYGRLSAVARAEAREFLGMRAMSRSQVLRLAAVNEMHRRLLAERRDEYLRITCSRDLYDRYAAELRGSPTEVVVLVILDAQNRVIRDVWFHGASPDSSHVSVRDLLRPALREYAIRVALIHNHPGADPRPSLGDLDFTKRLRQACDIVNLGLVDHVIVAEHGHYSFSEEGMLGA